MYGLVMYELLTRQKATVSLIMNFPFFKALLEAHAPFKRPVSSCILFCINHFDVSLHLIFSNEYYLKFRKDILATVEIIKH